MQEVEPMSAEQSDALDKADATALRGLRRKGLSKHLGKPIYAAVRTQATFLGSWPEAVACMSNAGVRAARASFHPRAQVHPFPAST